MKPVDVRRELVEALRLDLVGPENGSDLEAEILSQAPSRWYLTGFLVPLEASESQRGDGQKGPPTRWQKRPPTVGKKDRPHVHGLERARVNPGGSPRL